MAEANTPRVASKISNDDIAITKQCFADNPAYGHVRIQRQQPSKPWPTKALKQVVAQLQAGDSAARKQGSGCPAMGPEDIGEASQMAEGEATYAEASIACVAKSAGLPESKVPRILQGDLRLEPYRRIKRHRLSTKMKPNRMLKSTELAAKFKVKRQRKYAISATSFSDEKIFRRGPDMGQERNMQRVCRRKAGGEKAASQQAINRPTSKFQKGIMINWAVSKMECAAPAFIGPQVKVCGEYYANR